MPAGVARLKKEAAAVRPLLRSDLARRFLDATNGPGLPAPAPRTLFYDPDAKAFVREEDAAKRDEAARAKLKSLPVSEGLYYTTKYGSPLAYARALDVLAEKGGVKDLAGKRVLDFGYGSIGHLRLLASLGADAVGVDVDPFLAALYARPGDTGPVPAAPGAKAGGKVTLVDGRWPAEEAAKATVGGGFDLILSKNTLKNGYLHPEKPVDKRMLVDLGVSDEAYVKTLYDALKPGGRVLIYNLCPAPAKEGKPYIPWADGRSPFPREMWEKAGFKVVAIDVKDDDAARALGRALAWDQGKSPMDLQNDLFAWYTLVEKPGKS
jgi:SAM-dependent methyltransferase